MRKIITVISVLIFLLFSGTNLFATKGIHKDNKNYWRNYKINNWSGNNGWKQGKTWDGGYKRDWKHYKSWRGESKNYLKMRGWSKWRLRVNKDCKPPPGTNAPEPISSALFLLGGAGLGIYRKFKNKG